MKRILSIGVIVVMIFSLPSCATRAVYVQPGRPGYGRVVKPYNSYNSYGFGYSTPYNYYGGRSEHIISRRHH